LNQSEPNSFQTESEFVFENRAETEMKEIHSGHPCQTRH